MNSKVKALLVFAILVGVGFVITYFLKGTIDTAIQPFKRAGEDAKKSITTGIGNIQAMWASIPNEIKGLVALGIPSAFAVFFAWTKTRAMNKLQQTQLQAQQQFTQLSGEASQAQTQIKLLEQQKETLQNQYSQQLDGYKLQVANAPSQLELDQWKSNYEKLQNDYNTMERTYQNTINFLKQQQVTVVK